MRALLAIVMLAAVALAGCADEAAPQAADFPDLKLEASKETGVIRGVVVDAAIRPLEGVTIRITGPQEETMVTAADGIFGFDQLPPGTYFVKGEKAGFRAAQQSTDVVANVQDPKAVRLLLEVDPDATPYTQNFVFSGYIECSFSLVAVGFAACNTLPTGNDKFIVEYALDGTPDWAQSEMTWDNTQPVSEELNLLYSYDDGESALLNNYAEAVGKSPLVVTANRTVAEEVRLGAGTSLMIRVFNQHIEGTAPPDVVGGDDCIDRPALGGCVRGVGATVQQPFEIFTTVFYGYTPPEGWMFIDGDGVPGP